MLKDISQISEQAFLIDFGPDINIELNQYVLAFSNYIFEEMKNNNRLGIKNCVPSYNKILIQFEPQLNNKIQLKNFILSIVKKDTKFIAKRKTIEILVCYDDEFALDIKDVSNQTKLSKEDIINLHLSTDFYVYMIGFMPGLPFMGDLNDKLFVPRKLSPRVHVPSGSIGIVDKLCVIYPNDSPGGWNIIGRSPQIMFNKKEINPTLVKSGDLVKFKSISKKKYNELKMTYEKK